jgi:acetyltransferase-like isoleucine patch superfamily enzyme
MNKTGFDFVARLFGDNHPGIALRLIADRLWSEMSSRIMAYLLEAPSLHLGPGCRVIGGRHISFGRGIYAERNLWLEAVTYYKSQRFHPTITLGDCVCFSDGVHISSIASITIGSQVLMGSRIYISDHNHGIYKGGTQSRPEQAPSDRILGGGGPVTVGDNVWIGDNAVIIGPATIGNGAIIGANSVVRGAVQSNSIVAGMPAKLIKLFNSETCTWEKP